MKTLVGNGLEVHGVVFFPTKYISKENTSIDRFSFMEIILFLNYFALNRTVAPIFSLNLN